MSEHDDALIEVQNTHTAKVAGVSPGARGFVPAWILGEPIACHLRVADAPPPLPPLPPEGDEDEDADEDEDDGKLSAREARKLIGTLQTVEALEPFLSDPRSSVAEQARKRARALEGLEG